MKQTNSDGKKYPTKKYPVIGVCGLDCGLCPRFYTLGNSRCPGCGGPDFFNRHPSCSFITCCVKKKNLEVCAECPDYPCPKFKTVQEYQALETSAYPPYRKIIPNLNFIREQGLKKFIAQQRKRIKLLEMMIADFDDGRSRSFFCRTAALLDLTSLRSSWEKASQQIKIDQIKQNDVKNKAKILKDILKDWS